MKSQRLTIMLTLINLILLAYQIAQSRRAVAENDAPVLRGRGLEIVDGQGRIRASITVEPSVTVDSQRFPETVLLRLTDPKSGPVVKITATEEGSAIGLSDDAEGGVQVSSTKRKGNFVKVVSREGKEQVIQP